MKIILSAFFLTLCILLPFTARCDEKFFVVKARKGAGMFSSLDDVLGALKSYDKGEYPTIKINFSNQGVYYSAEKGENWFTYYFQPIVLGNPGGNAGKGGGDIPGGKDDISRHTTRAEAYVLIQKYLHIKPWILAKVADFQTQHFAGHYVICVHYRGTDKFFSEAPYIPYHTLLKVIQREIDAHSHRKCKIFVATDEQPFIAHVTAQFGEMVCYENFTRSIDDNPIHLNSINPFKSGKEALIDALLLSRGDCLIRTSSNLSRWSTYFNPIIAVTEVKHN